MSMERTILWLTGYNRWRSLITSIWYECVKDEYNTELYNGVDGVLRERYREEIIEWPNKYKNNGWISLLINETLKQDYRLMLVDMGIEGEHHLREWIQSDKYRIKIFEDRDEIQNIVIAWGGGRDIKRIRSWYRGNLGIFDNREFEANSYYEDMEKILDRWESGKMKWSQLLRKTGNLQRCRLKFAEDHIKKNLKNIID